MARQATTRRAEIGRERRARMRNRLIEAAARVMADQGSDNATIDTFIRAAGVARGTFYNHFKTREELLDALWTSIGHDPFLEIQNACKDWRTRWSASPRLPGWCFCAPQKTRPGVGSSSRCQPMRRRSTMICAVIRVRTCARAQPRAIPIRERNECDRSSRRDHAGRAESASARRPRSKLRAGAVQNDPASAWHQSHRSQPDQRAAGAECACANAPPGSRGEEICRSTISLIKSIWSRGFGSDQC